VHVFASRKPTAIWDTPLPHTADVTLRLDTNVAATVHKSLLQAASPVFAAMFNSQLLESQTSLVQIAAVCNDGQILKTFLACLYRPDLDWCSAHAVESVAYNYFTIRGETLSSSTASTAAAVATEQPRLQDIDETHLNDYGLEGKTLSPLIHASSLTLTPPHSEHSYEQQRKVKPQRAYLLTEINLEQIEAITLPLLQVAHHYQVAPLVHRIESNLLATLCVDTVEQYYAAALLYGLKRLTNACCAFVAQRLHACALAGTDRFYVDQDDDNKMHQELLQMVGPLLLEQTIMSEPESKEPESKEPNIDFAVLANTARLAAALVTLDDELSDHGLSDE